MRKMVFFLVLTSLSCSTQAVIPAITPSPISANTATFVANTPETVPDIELPLYLLVTSAVNVRDYPASANARILKVLDAGEAVHATCRSDGWCKLFAQDGWIWRGCTDQPDGKMCVSINN